MKMGKVIPTVFARSKKEFDERFYKVIKIAKNIQIDIGDGKFVGFKSIGINEIPNLKKYKNRFEVHLMVKNPENYVDSVRKKGFKKIIFHYEALQEPDKIEKLIAKIKKLKIKAFIAVNPETQISEILLFLKKVDGILVMGIHPGKEQQQFIKEVYGKIDKLRKFNKKIEIEVDGGVSFENIGRLAELGVDYVNSGSLVAEADKPEETIKKLEKMFRKR